MPVRPDICTLNTVSYGSQLLNPLMARKPLPWLKLTEAPPRRLVTFVTWYPLSRSRTEVPEGFVTTCTYCVFGSVLLIVVYPYPPLPKSPAGMPPYMKPPPSTPCTDSQIGPM